MYLGLFDRTADNTGLKDWTEKLDNGNSRESVFYGFADSQEFRKLAESFGLDSTWAGTAVEYKIGKADFIQILLDNENVWKLGRDKINTSNRTTPGYSLVDLNLDGTLELIVSAASGADEDTPVKVYRIQNECLIEVGTCVDRGYDVLINNLSLNQDKRTGEYVYMANYKGPTCLSYIDVRYSANSVEKYSRWWNGYENGNTQGKFIYKVGGKPVSETYANGVLNSFVGHWRNANLKKGYVANKDWVKYSKDEKKKALESLYDAFSYEK